jgi:hypothetical protein
MWSRVVIMWPIECLGICSRFILRGNLDLSLTFWPCYNYLNLGISDFFCMGSDMEVPAKLFDLLVIPEF